MNTSVNGQKSCSYRGAKLWNALANEVKLAPSLSGFKSKLLLNKNDNKTNFRFLSILSL